MMNKYMIKELDKRFIGINLIITLITLVGLIILVFLLMDNRDKADMLSICIIILIFIQFGLKKLLSHYSIKRILYFELKQDTLLEVKIKSKGDHETWSEETYEIDEVNFYNLKLYNKKRQCEIIYITNMGNHESIIFNFPNNNATKSFLERLKKYAEACLIKKAGK